MNVPFADLTLQYQSLKSEIDLAISNVIRDTAFIGGRANFYVTEFEAGFSAWLGIPHTVGVANGTDALEIVLSAWGIGPGDEVIVPALSWFSTAEAVVTVGARPVFVDVLPGIHTIDPDQIEALISPATKAIIPVHLYGQMARMEKIMAIAEQHGLKVLEDCAQSHGAERLGRKAGTWGHASSFSFYPGKNLGAYGDAGAICTSDADLAEICRQISNHGQIKKHIHVRNGRNSRLDGIQAAILSVKLPWIDSWNALRNARGLQYLSLLQGSEYGLPLTDTDNKHIYHLMVIHHARRDALVDYLKKQGIETALHYPYPLPYLPALEYLKPVPDLFPVCSQACDTLVSIPMFPELRPEQVEYVSTTLQTFLKS